MVASKIKVDHSFFWNKLFSFSGIFPVGAFLAEHFWANSYALVSVGKYDETSRGLQQIPWRVPVEFLFIWLPILFHGGYGVYVWWRGKSNLVQYPWMGNWMYSVQRWTGIMAFAFIGWHVWTERFLTHGKSDFVEVQHNLQNPYFLGFYLIGVVASSVHLGNGSWNFLCKWGVAATARSQHSAAWLGAVVALVFSLVGMAIVLSIRFSWRPFEIYVQ